MPQARADFETLPEAVRLSRKGLTHACMRATVAAAPTTRGHLDGAAAPNHVVADRGFADLHLRRDDPVGQALGHQPQYEFDLVVCELVGLQRRPPVLHRTCFFLRVHRVVSNLQFVARQSPPHNLHNLHNLTLPFQTFPSRARSGRRAEIHIYYYFFIYRL